jgi:hypothetical protein
MVPTMGEVAGIARLHQGVVLADLVPELEVFPDERSWSARLRQPLVRLPPSDARLIERRLAPLTRSLVEVLDDYMAEGTRAHKNAILGRSSPPSPVEGS